ncbi:SDR family oxidoreductase [Skermanella stibiiresistens]|uniref:SDR family oxidoreductase n=1 Tax=Skermanella stibiiresistens TaxID=913326 RepID=UPI0004B3AE51|nr:SDR family oxidoreductase [Skermanella stibiiresistens]
MKIVVIGGTGLIGSKTVRILRDAGHEVVAASPATGIDTITGEGLAASLAGARVVLDLVNSPSLENEVVLDFFETWGRHPLAAEAAAKIGHHGALSRGRDGAAPGEWLLPGQAGAGEAGQGLRHPSHTIVQSTQFFEFLAGIIQSGARPGTKSSGQPGAGADIVRLSPAPVQPIASDDVAAAMAGVALAEPVNGTIEIAGPERPPERVGRALFQGDQGSAPGRRRHRGPLFRRPPG